MLVPPRLIAFRDRTDSNVIIEGKTWPMPGNLHDNGHTGRRDLDVMEDTYLRYTGAERAERALANAGFRVALDAGWQWIAAENPDSPVASTVIEPRTARTPVLDGTAPQREALAVGDQVIHLGQHRYDTEWPGTILKIDRLHSVIFTDGNEEEGMPAEHFKRVMPSLEGCCQHCGIDLTESLVDGEIDPGGGRSVIDPQRDIPHNPGCPDGDGFEDLGIHEARKIAEWYATHGGRYPQYEGAFECWWFGRATRELLDMSERLIAHPGERVLFHRAYPDNRSGIDLVSMMSTRQRMRCDVYAGDIDPEQAVTL